MAEHRLGLKFPAGLLRALVMAVLLVGCVQASPETELVSSLQIPMLESEEPAGTQPDRTTPVLTGNNGAPDGRPAGPDATGTSLAISLAGRQVRQTLAAQSSATQAARQAMEAHSATSTALATTPIPGPTVALPPTPTPISLLARFFEPLASFDGVLPGLVLDLRVSPDGILWVINEYGVASLTGSTWKVHFPDVTFWLAGFDGAGRTWLVNEPGTAVLSWNGSEWQVYGDREGWLPIHTHRLLLLGQEMVTDRAGRIWMTAYQDVRSFDGREWTVHSQREIGFEPYAETAQYNGFYFPALERDLQGNLWIGNCDSRGEELAGQGARWFNGATWQGNIEPTASGCVRDIAVDSEGNVWLGIDDLLWRFEPDKNEWTRFDLPEPPADMRIGWVEDIRFGPDGNPWLAVALCGGASCGSSYLRYQLQPERWVEVPQPDEFELYRLYFDPDGNAWLFSGERLFLVRGTSLEQVQDVDICTIAQDGSGWLYLAARQNRMKLIFVERGGR
jgi:hypothetical protein